MSKNTALIIEPNNKSALRLTFYKSLNQSITKNSIDAKPVHRTLRQLYEIISASVLLLLLEEITDLSEEHFLFRRLSGSFGSRFLILLTFELIDSLDSKEDTESHD